MTTARMFTWLGHALRRSSAQPTPVSPPIERITADLRRLGAEAYRVHGDQQRWARAFRLRALERAYDDTLLLACRALEVDVEGRDSPLSNLDRIQLEIELARRGLRW